MIKKETLLEIIDNSGATKAKCFGLYRCGDAGSIGDIIKVSIVKCKPALNVKSSSVKKGSVHRAIIVKTKYRFARKYGEYISFDKNAAILINDKGEPIGTRILQAVPREVSQKIRSIAEGVC